MNYDEDESGPPLHLSTINVYQLQGETGDASEPYREILRNADVVFARDKASQREVLFYGKELVEDIARGRQSEFDAKDGVTVELNTSPDSPDIEFLFALVEVLKGKGSCCYGRK